MTPKEFAQKATLGEASDVRGAEDGTAALREEIVELARALPGELRRLTVRSGDRAIDVEWAAPGDGSGAQPHHAFLAPRRPDAAVEEEPGTASEVPEGIDAVRAPLVGTFYVAPTPGADPFVQVGDEVEPGQTLAIVEAMKLMNPIVADAPG